MLCSFAELLQHHIIIYLGIIPCHTHAHTKLCSYTNDCCVSVASRSATQTLVKVSYFQGRAHAMAFIIWPPLQYLSFPYLWPLFVLTVSDAESAPIRTSDSEYCFLLLRPHLSYNQLGGNFRWTWWFGQAWMGEQKTSSWVA